MITPELAVKLKKDLDEALYQDKIDKVSDFIENELLKGNRLIKVSRDFGIFKIKEIFYDRFDTILECWDSLYEMLRDAGWKPRLTIHKKDSWIWGKEHYLEIKF